MIQISQGSYWHLGQESSLLCRTSCPYVTHGKMDTLVTLFWYNFITYHQANMCLEPVTLYYLPCDQVTFLHHL